MPGGSSNQETPRRRRSPPPKATDSDAHTAGEVFDERPRRRSRLDAEVSRWADILGVVLGFLPGLADRASARSVCRHWRATARSHALPPPWPLLVLPKVSLSGLTSEGALTAPMPDTVTAGEARCVNAFSHKVVCLPCLRAFRYNGSDCSYKTLLPVINGGGQVRCRTHDIYTLLLRNVVLSASPDSGSKFIVAACSDYMSSTKIVVWQPGMISWLVCTGDDICGPKDLAFYVGRLYVLQRHRAHLFAFELKKDDREIIFSRVDRCVTEQLPPHPLWWEHRSISSNYNIVVWRGRLLLIIRYHHGHYPKHKVVDVKVFALDFGKNPCGVIKIHTFDGGCIFVGSGSCKSFPAFLNEDVEGDLIYFVPDYKNPYHSFVYNMREGKMRPFAAELLRQFCPNLSAYNFGPRDRVDFPVWLFPSE